MVKPRGKSPKRTHKNKKKFKDERAKYSRLHKLHQDRLDLQQTVASSQVKFLPIDEEAVAMVKDIMKKVRKIEREIKDVCGLNYKQLAKGTK